MGKMNKKSCFSSVFFKLSENLLAFSQSDFHVNIGILVMLVYSFTKMNSQPAFTCSKLTIETLEQGVKYVQS